MRGMAEIFLSVNDFAKAAGFTPQGIYKRLSDEENELHRFCRKENGKTVISAAALAAIFDKEYKPQEQEQPKEEEKQSSDKIIEILREQIEAQRKDIEEKNKLIDRLSTQLETEQRLLNQEQQLNYANTQKILALEAAAEEKEAASAAPIEEKKKKSIFSWFRKKESAAE